MTCNINIYMDALTLLLSKTDIKEAIKDQLNQGDDYFFDQIRNGLEKENATEKVLDAFDEADTDNLLNYITFDENKITFDYAESEACCDLKVVAFDIPCEFDCKKFIEDNQ